MDKKLEKIIARLESLLSNRKCVNEGRTYLKESEDKILEIQDTLIGCLSDIDYMGMKDTEYFVEGLGDDCNKHLSNASELIGKACDELSKAVDSINELPYM